MPLMERRTDRRPWGLITGLVLAASMGVVSIPLQVLTYLSVDDAGRADVERNRQVIREIGNSQVQLCETVADIARQARLTPQPCPTRVPIDKP